jgi:hypothetical protein
MISNRPQPASGWIDRRFSISVRESTASIDAVANTENIKELDAVASG